MSRWVTARRSPGLTVPLSPTPASASRRGRLGRAQAERAHVELDEVRLHLREGDREPARGPALGEPAGSRVVVGEALDVVLERVEAAGGDDPGLPHRPAEAVLGDPRARHQLARAGDQRPERAAEPLGEAERHGVEEAPELGGGDPGCNRGVRDPGAVEVDAESELARGRDGRAELRQRPDRAARAVVGVFEREQAHAGAVERVCGVDRVAQLLGGDAPAAGPRGLASVAPSASPPRRARRS